MKVIIISGGFDPLHSGHILYLKDAKNRGDHLIVALNSDLWIKNKKGKAFMTFEERKIILESIESVDEVIEFADDEYGSCIDALEKVKSMYPSEEIYFANGGDRNAKNIPEMSVKGINFIFGIGGDFKKNSSSDLLQEWVDFKLNDSLK